MPSMPGSQREMGFSRFFMVFLWISRDFLGFSITWFCELPAVFDGFCILSTGSCGEHVVIFLSLSKSKIE